VIDDTCQETRFDRPRRDNRGLRQTGAGADDGDEAVLGRFARGSFPAAALRRLQAGAALSAAGLRRVFFNERGTVHSWTITHHAFHAGFKVDLPFLLLTVDLEEGVRMQAQGKGIGEELRIGLPVKVGFQRVKDDLTLPVFEKA
jgi:hypothetical protein